jgi:hypothetical protein
MNIWRYRITAVGIALMTAYGCDNSRANMDAEADRTAAPGTTAPAADGLTSLAAIAGNPDSYLGRTVTVVADVEEVHGPLAFSLDEDAPLAGGVDNDVLVLSPKAGSLRDIDDQWLNNKVRVTGKVAKLTVVEAERELGWDLNPELEVEVERSRAVLIATSVERTNR